MTSIELVHCRIRSMDEVPDLIKEQYEDEIKPESDVIEVSNTIRLRFAGSIRSKTFCH